MRGVTELLLVKVGIGDPYDDPAGLWPKREAGGFKQGFQGILGSVVAPVGVLVGHEGLKSLHVPGEWEDVLDDVQECDHTQAEVDSPMTEAVGELHDVVLHSGDLIRHAAGYVESEDDVHCIDAGGAVLLEGELPHTLVVLEEEDVLRCQPGEEAPICLLVDFEGQGDLRVVGQVEGVHPYGFFFPGPCR